LNFQITFFLFLFCGGLLPNSLSL